MFYESGEKGLTPTNKDTDMKRRQLLAKSGVALGTAFGIAGCGGGGGLTIVNHRLSRGRGGVAVVGIARNETDSTIGYAQIEASFFSNGTRLGSGLANINDLSPGRDWEFEALYMGMDGDRVDDYELSVSP